MLCYSTADSKHWSFYSTPRERGQGRGHFELDQCVLQVHACTQKRVKLTKNIHFENDDDMYVKTQSVSPDRYDVTKRCVSPTH